MAIPSPEETQDWITAFCCSPSAKRHPAAEGVLHKIMGAETDAAARSIAQTSTSIAIWEALNRCSSARSPVLIEGPARIGKSAAVRAWCQARGGEARYVATPHGNDLDSLLRAIGSAIGSASGLSFKAKQVEERIIRSIPGSGLTLVFDDAWHLWPQGDTRQSHPRRLQWLLALLEAGVGVALVTTPQWWDCRRAYIAQTAWAIEQLEGRLGRVVSLSGNLTNADCCAIAKVMAPEAGPDAWEILGALAVRSSRRLGAMEAVVLEASHAAREAGLMTPTDRQIKESAIAAIDTDARLAREMPISERPAKRSPFNSGRGKPIRRTNATAPLHSGGMPGREAAETLPGSRASTAGDRLGGREISVGIRNGGSEIAPPEPAMSELE